MLETLNRWFKAEPSSREVNKKKGKRKERKEKEEEEVEWGRDRKSVARRERDKINDTCRRKFTGSIRIRILYTDVYVRVCMYIDIMYIEAKLRAPAHSYTYRT